MILLLIDIGNTRVKWARLMDGKMGKQQAAANAGWTTADYARRVVGRGWSTPHRAPTSPVPLSAGIEADTAITSGRPAFLRARAAGPRARADAQADIGTTADRIIISSVAGDKVNRALIEAARKAGAPTPEFVTSERTAAGVTTDYIDPWRLGVDRFVAAIGAFHLGSGHPVCVVNVGTAMTIDLVDGAGRHRGGAIVPGPALMVSSLLTNTNGIRIRAKGGPDGASGMFAKTTRNAIGEGARYAAAGAVDRAIEESRLLVGNRPLVLLTGGGSADIKPLIRSTCVSLPDLVLHGLAVWAHKTPARPLPMQPSPKRAQPSGKPTQTSRKRTQTPRKRTQTPRKRTQTPRKRAHTSRNRRSLV